MRAIAIGLAALLGAATLDMTIPAHAQGENCQDLWVSRNSIYKARGYCFKTARAIGYFGNGGCKFYNEAAVPLTPADRATIARIRARERALGCPL
jgi:hypothetical protein